MIGLFNRAYGDCMCECHRTDMHHIVPCCSPMDEPAPECVHVLKWVENEIGDRNVINGTLKWKCWECQRCGVEVDGDPPEPEESPYDD